MTPRNPQDESMVQLTNFLENQQKKAKSANTCMVEEIAEGFMFVMANKRPGIMAFDSLGAFSMSPQAAKVFLRGLENRVHIYESNHGPIVTG